MIDIVALNCEYSHVKTGETCTVVGFNEIKPQYEFFKMMNRYKPDRVMPLVEFIDDQGNYHVYTLEHFLLFFEEIS